MKLKKRKATPMDWGKTAVLTLLYLCFLYWVDAWWGLIVVPLIFDAYITRWIPWTWWKDLKNPVARTLMSWVDAIVFALVAVYFFNIYFFQNYNIPSSSLEKTLLVGDYLVVNKMAYGPRVPQTPLHMPLVQHTMPSILGLGGCKSYIEWPQWKYKRVHPKPVALNDIVVFNYPAGDTIVTAQPYQTEYYSLCYGIGGQLWEQEHGAMPPMDSLSPMQQRKLYSTIYSLGKQYISMDERDFGHIDTRPVDRRENYVKRCVGLPGQTLQIKNRVMYLDGKVNPDAKNVQYNYEVSLVGESIPTDLAERLGISQDDLKEYYQSGILPLTQAAKAALEKRKDVVAGISITHNNETGSLYPQNAYTGWTCDNYGPIWIPKKGATIRLTLDNLPIYERPIRAYEGNDLQVTPDGKILINGKEAHEYTFRMDYYWMQGDNRHNSADSRYWGFVPEDHVVGKPVLVWFSTDKDYPLLSLHHIRWNRLFRWVSNMN